MDITELEEIELDIEEAFLEVGSRSILLERLTTTKDDSNIYGEAEEFTYTEQLPLLGVANINPVSDDISDVGKSLNCTIVLTVGSKCLRENALYVDNKLSISTDDIFVYLGKRYQVKNIAQNAILNDLVLIFNFECIYVGDENGE